jgi:hypothetical protein
MISTMTIRIRTRSKMNSTMVTRTKQDEQHKEQEEQHDDNEDQHEGIDDQHNDNKDQTEEQDEQHDHNDGHCQEHQVRNEEIPNSEQMGCSIPRPEDPGEYLWN